jgi:hypothetical protein
MYTNERLLDEDEEVIETYLARLNGRAWGISIGLVLGLGLFAAKPPAHCPGRGCQSHRPRPGWAWPSRRPTGA